MGRLIVIEGIDGAGKNTLARRLTSEWESKGLDVLRLGFPRYGESVHADLAAEALRGQHGDLATSVHGMALMFALDRRAMKRELEKLIHRSDIVLLDRYVASNAAYSAARLHESADGGTAEWVRELEFDRFSLPRPDVQILLDVPVALAQERATGREELDSNRTRDIYERDGGLQQRTSELYRQLAAASWVSPWVVYDGVSDPVQLAADLENQPSRAQEVTP